MIRTVNNLDFHGQVKKKAEFQGNFGPEFFPQIGCQFKELNFFMCFIRWKSMAVGSIRWKTMA